MTSLTQSLHAHTRSLTIKAVSTAVIIVGAIFSSVAAPAQDRSVRDEPRSFEVFERFPGYELFSADRHGPMVKPHANELGFSLVLRMFRTVCLAVEQGEDPKDVAPEGYSVHNFNTYFFGPGTPPSGEKVALSSTGDIEMDEDDGLPSIWFEPRSTGMICGIDWPAKDMTPDSQQAIAGLILHWLPWELALVRASRPMTLYEPPLSDAIEWDRPCGNRWCPLSAFYSLSRGEVFMRMTLNITEIAGPRP